MMKTNSEGLSTLRTIGEQIKWLVENDITHDEILLELSPLDEYVEYIKQLNSDELSFEQLPIVLLKVENRIHRFKRLLDAKAAKHILEHEAHRLHITLKHLDLFFRGKRLLVTESAVE